MFFYKILGLLKLIALFLFFKICNATSQEEIDTVIGEDEERFIDNCGWPRTDMVTVRNQYI